MELNNREGRRNFVKSLRKTGKPKKAYHKMSRKATEALQGTIGFGGKKTYGYPTRKSTGRPVTWN